MGKTDRIGVVLFEGFELLDVCGPLEMFGLSADRFSIELIGPVAGAVTSACGPNVGPNIIADHSYADAPDSDIVLMPGGLATHQLVDDDAFLAWLHDWASPAPYVTSVCTGSGVLAAAGLLTGFRATSNKRAFGWARTQGDGVEWIPEARWVEDRNRWTSSGVAAGMDMTLALIRHLYGEDLASQTADRVEYEWHRNPDWDPFAAKSGLPPG